jgi:branched-chain amino acid transport system substrate-binding protein
MVDRPIIGAVALSLFSGIASNACAQDVVKVGMVMPLTGALGVAGKQVVAGARLYIQQHGDTVAGKHIELIVKDDNSSAETGKREIQELIVNDKVDVLGGGLTPDLLGSAAMITAAKKPTVVMLSSTTAVIEKSPYLVRTSCTIAQSAGIMADWAIQNTLKRAMTLVSDFAPGLEAEATFKNNYEAQGGEIADAIRVPLQNPDFAPFLQRVKDVAPQTLFMFIPSVQAAAFAKQFVERGLDKLNIRVIGPGDIVDDQALPQMGNAMVGTVTAHFYSLSHPSALNKTFSADYQKQNGDRANFMAVSGYDGMNAIYEALKKTGGSSDGDAFVAAMKGLAWESPRGPMSIDKTTGEVVHNIYIRKVEEVDGQLQNVEFATFNAVKDPRIARK